MGPAMPETLYAHPDRFLFGFGLFAALLAWNVYRPLRAPVSIGVVSFFIGWLTGELAMHHIALQIASLAYFTYAGALSAPLGVAGAGFTVIAMAALARYHETGHATGSSHTSTFDDAGMKLLGDKVAPTSVIRPFHMKRKRVVVDRAVEVARVGNVVLRADVYHRDDLPKDAPVVLYIHGGAWVIGYKKYQGLPILNELAEQGFVCISASYRLSPGATFPEHAHDAFRAVAWARQNVAKYGGDPARISVVGNSAGGHLAAIVALGHREPRLRPPELGDVDLSTFACVSLYGVFDVTNRHGHWPGQGMRPFMERMVLKANIADDPDLFRLASPIDLIEEDSPPFLVIHGNRDSLVPVGESRRFVDALRAKATTLPVYLEVEGAQHAFDIFHSVRGRYAVRAIVTYLGERATHAATGRSAESRMESPACVAS